MKFPSRVYPHHEPEFLSDERPELDGEWDYEDRLADGVKDDPYFERVDHEYSEWKDSYRDPEGANGGNRRREP